MPYVSENYDNNRNAPKDHYVCDPHSPLGRTKFKKSEPPTKEQQTAPNYCGGCVAFVKQVCPQLPQTKLWQQGVQVRGNPSIKPGTVIANFVEGKFHGHAAIYVSQDPNGIHVYEQFIEPPKPIGPRLIKWDPKQSAANDGNKFYIVEKG